MCQSHDMILILLFLIFIIEHGYCGTSADDNDHKCISFLRISHSKR